MHTRRRFFALSSLTALGVTLLPSAAVAKPGVEAAAADLSVPPATDLQSEFERYFTCATADQCEGARQMCSVDKRCKESSHG